MPQKELSGYAVGTLVFAFLFAPIAYILSYFAVKEISQGERRGRGFVLGGLLFSVLMTFLSALGAAMYFGSGFGTTIPTLILGIIAVIGIIAMNQMMKQQYFSKGPTIVYIIIFLLLMPVALAGILTGGVLTPSSFVPERCVMNAEFSCNDYEVQSTSSGTQVNLRIQNNLGSPVTIQTIIASIRNQQGTCEDPTEPVPGGQQTTITCQVPVQLSPGEFTDVDITGEYLQTGRNFEQRINGQITARVQ